MEFRPCIDIHNGKVKQIVGGSLTDENDYAKENFVSDMQASDYAKLYQKANLVGGHIILLNHKDSPYYEQDLQQAEGALRAWPGALQIGGGITAQNAASFLDMGASHVIVTSYVFVDGKIRYDRLEKLLDVAGKDHIVLDLSCRKKGETYYVVTDRWQKFTEEPLTAELFARLSSYCDEFLVHAVNVEGTGTGVDTQLLQLLAECVELPITYAGGIGSIEDIETIHTLGHDRIHFTVGSALDLFGGKLEFSKLALAYHKA